MSIASDTQDVVNSAGMRESGVVTGEVFEAELDLPLDPGIRDYVLRLRCEGVETFESCEGGPSHAFPEPTIRFYGNHVEGFRAFSVAMNYGFPVFNLRRVYDVDDGELVGPWWEMTFRTTGHRD